MAIYKFSNAGGFANYTRYNDFLAGNPAVILDKGSMYPLGVFTLSSSQANVEFTNIPQTYTHLQLRLLAKTTNATDIWGRLEINGTNGARVHELYADGSTVAAYTDPNIIYLQRFVGTNASNTFTAMTIDILDYRNTNKNKVTRHLGGYDANGSGVLAFASGLWASTSAINAIRISMGSGNIAVNSSFALYGIL
jgi:hypothetical protein